LIDAAPLRSEEAEYAGLHGVTPAGFVAVPLQPEVARTVQTLLASQGLVPKPAPVPQGGQVLLLTYSLSYGEPLWWTTQIFLYGHPGRPPDEFEVELKLRLYALETTTGSLVGYPELSVSTKTHRLATDLANVRTDTVEALGGSNPLTALLEEAFAVVLRVSQVLNGKGEGLSEDVRRTVARSLMQAADWQVRCRGASLFARTAQAGDLPLLARLLEDREFNVGLTVVSELVQHLNEKGPRSSVHVLPLLRTALLDHRASIRTKAVEGLGKTRLAEAFASLAIAAKDEEHDVRESAATALGEIGGERAVPLLLALLDDDTGAVAAKAAEALDKLGWEPREVAQKVRVLLVKGHLPDLVSLGTGAVPALIRVLQGSNATHKRVAVEALGQIGDPQAVPPLLAVLAGDDAKMVAQAATALGQIRDRRALAPLATLLREKDADVIMAATQSLVTLGDRGAVDPLQRALAARAEPDAAALWMRAGLAHFGVQREEHVAHLIEALSSEAAEVAGEALGTIALTSEEVAQLMTLLASTDPGLRKRAAYLVARHGGDRGVEHRWTRLAHEQDEQVRAAIREALRTGGRKGRD
jgi:HEAT repeat protein